MVMECNSGKRDDESVLAMTKCGLGRTMRPATHDSVQGICRSTLVVREQELGVNSIRIVFRLGVRDFALASLGARIRNGSSSRTE
jgi:hypothetical protein